MNDNFSSRESARSLQIEMMKHCQEKHLQVIEHLKTKYDFTWKELKILEDIKKFTINSIAFTTDGGFDVETGEFHPEERKENYKIRIIYEDQLSSKENFICMKPIYVNDYHSYNTNA